MRNNQYFEGAPPWIEWPFRSKLSWYVFLPVLWVAGFLLIGLLAPIALVLAFLTRHSGEPKGVAQELNDTGRSK